MKAVLDVQAVPDLGGRRVHVRWTIPPASAFADAQPLSGITVVRRQRSYPLTATDGDVVYAGGVVSEVVDGGLTPLTTYYYRVFTTDGGANYYSDDGSCASALATEDYGSAERLYRMLPAVHLRDDRLPERGEAGELDPAAAAALAALRPALRRAGPLRRFMEVAGAPFDLMRSTAEALPQLRDLDRVPPEFLSLLGQWVDWPTDRTQPVYSQRNEVRFAPRLYRTVGTVENLRAIVNRYTGWYAQVAEFHQHIARSNLPPAGNVFSLRLEGGAWRAADDGSATLGFAAANSEALGKASSPAVLAGTSAGPFALWPGAEITVTADDRVPVTVRLGPADFVDIGRATAAEIVTVLNRHLSEVTAGLSTLLAGAIQLRSNTVGPASSVKVEHPAASLVTLEGAPRGRLAVASGANRNWLVYEATDPEANLDSGPGGSGGGPVVVPGNWRSLRCKVLRRGSWSASVALPRTGPQGDPALVALPPVAGRERLLAAWVDKPGTDAGQLRYAVGSARLPRPATLVGDRSGPFAIPRDGLLLIRVGGRSVGVQFAPSDTAYPAAATAGEVVAALNARLRGVVARVAPGNRLAIEAVAGSGDGSLEIDLRASTAAAGLGFGPANARAEADLGDGVDWGPALEIPGPRGRYADLHAAMQPAGTVRLAWSWHDGTAWQIATAIWNGTVWGATETLTSGHLGHREPWVAQPGGGDVWVLWSLEGPAGAGWCLRRRVYTTSTGTWGPETAVTGHEVGRIGDRQSAAIVVGSALQVVFASDRGGGRGLWSLSIPLATGVGGAPTQVTTGPAAESWPTPFYVATVPWMVFRSDRSVALGREGTHPLPEAENWITEAPVPPRAPAGSVRAADTGTLRRYAGTTTLDLGDADRIRRRRQWDDLITYTPVRPSGVASEAPLRDDDLYTRGTVGLYLSRVVSTPLSDQMVDRLRSVLDRFLPVDTRAVVILAPRVDIELVYPPGADIVERYEDRHPEIDYFEGIGERASVVMPRWQVLRTPVFPPKPADPRSAGVTGNPSDPDTFRYRTFYPPPT